MFFILDFHPYLLTKSLYFPPNKQSLVAGGVSERLATALIYLKHLKLSYVSLDVLSEVSFILCLLRSSPNVKTIEISFFHEQRVDASLAYKFLVAQDSSDLNLNQLVKVKLEYLNGTENEMHFIKALLENVPKLETLEIDSIGELNGDS
ncbi:hypothetical protein ACH5RR_028989 [Cinchona calisaya]|uniref:FBD domain-containing protein n=1 Tax=Cinchona calisaya TaxID=153742 RepID=A0ABD2YRK6_9GENT